MNNSIASQETESTVSGFFSRHKIGKILLRCNFAKRCGYDAGKLLQTALSLVLYDKNWIQTVVSGCAETAKDTMYRLINSPYFNWAKLLLLAGMQAIGGVAFANNEGRAYSLIIDDTLYERRRSKKVELLAKAHDHSEGRHTRGFRMLSGVWTDGATSIPLFCQLLSSQDPKNRFEEANPAIDGRTNGGKNRKRAVAGMVGAAIEFVRQAKECKALVDYVLFDSWFACPKFFRAIKEIGFSAIGRLKEMPRIYYVFEGEKCTLSQLGRTVRKRPGLAKLLACVKVSTFVSKEGLKAGLGPVEMQIVFVRNKNKHKEWIAIGCTDLGLAPEEIVRLYGRRWNIECMFKVCKSYLALAKEFQSRSFDGVSASAFIVLLRYTMLAELQRRETDLRTLGDLFRASCEEARDVHLCEALDLLLEYFENFLNKQFLCTESYMANLVFSFMLGLPAFLREKLEKGARLRGRNSLLLA